MKMSLKLNKPAFGVLVLYPAFLIALLVHFLMHHSFSFFAFGLILGGFYVSTITVGIGLHRLWSHNAYKLNSYVEFFLALLAAGTLQGPILAWASDHYRHHTFTDKESDPHTPTKFQNPILGFLWAHMGWMLFDPTPKIINRAALVKLGRNKIVLWQLKYYWPLAIFMNTVFPALIGYILGGSLESAYMGFLFIGLGRTLQQQSTFMVNSVCHFWGRKPYSHGTARDIWWLAMFLLGENWHNFHHAFPSDYRNGHKWHHLDVHKWIIAGLEKIGLAYSLDRTDHIRIHAKIMDKSSSDITSRAEKIALIKERIEFLNQRISQLPGMESFTKNVCERIEKLHKKTIVFKEKALRFEIKVDKKSIEKQLRRLEKSVQSLENKLFKVIAAA